MSRVRGATVGSVLIATSFVLCAVPLAAQSVPRVATGWGIDTLAAAWSEHTWHADAIDIFRVWRTYLLSAPERQAPTQLWSQTEQRRSIVYDHTAGAACKGFPATVLDIRPVEGEPNVFVIRTLFTSVGGDSRVIRPVALTRVYAFREGERWVLGSSLAREMRERRSVRIGSFDFVSMSRPLNRARAQRVVAFADSLADALHVERVKDVSYAVAESPEALHRLMGIDWTFGGLGHGYALPGLLLSGDARFGEENRHEIVHLVLQAIVREGRTHGMINEGMATWLGGSVGSSYSQLLAQYAAYLAANADITLDTILEGDGPDEGWRPAGAVLVDLVFARRGTAGLLELLRSGRSNDELRRSVASLLGMEWRKVNAAWRGHIVNPGRPFSPPNGRGDAWICAG